MSEYNFQEIEKKWQQKWKAENAFSTHLDPKKPKFYTLWAKPFQKLKQFLLSPFAKKEMNHH